MIKKYWHDVQIAIDAIQANKLKSLLTALGIIFGVAAVISMLAIGNGAQQEILDQMQLVGVNNIVITPADQSEQNSKDESSEDDESSTKPKKFSPGLSLKDATGILETLPTVQKISPHIFYNSYVIFNGKRENAQIEGIQNTYFELFSYQLDEGRFFNEIQAESGLPVCIIGSDIRKRFFDKVNPIGKYLKCGNEWLKVVGVLEKRNITSSSIGKVVGGNSNSKIYIPINTMLLRYKNRSAITSGKLKGKVFRMGRSMITTGPEGSDNYNQLDKIVVQVKSTEQLELSTEILNRYFFRRHSDIQDFEITVPELLLRQQQKTKDIFNLVLGAIASISLIVGGIGIMNIMLASVMERIKEIGTRQAIGATKLDIVIQFLAESTLISVAGGLIGVVLGIVLSNLISSFADIKTIISPFSVFIAFGVSAGIGILFGYLPAKKASDQNPVLSLHHE